MIGPWKQNDGIFAGSVHADVGMAGALIGRHDMARVHAIFHQTLCRPAPVGPDRPDVHDPRGGARGGHRHVRALAAQALADLRRRERFARASQMRHTIDVVRVDRAEVVDRHQPTLQAARTAMFRMSFAVDTVEQIWIDPSMPDRIGPITVAPAISCISFTEMLAE